MEAPPMKGCSTSNRPDRTGTADVQQIMLASRKSCGGEGRHTVAGQLYQSLAGRQAPGGQQLLLHKFSSTSRTDCVSKESQRGCMVQATTTHTAATHVQHFQVQDCAGAV